MMDRVWSENGRDLGHWGLAARWLIFVLSFFVIASLAGFFLFPSGKINNFPTYMTGLVTMFYLALHPAVIGWAWKSRVFLAAVSLAVYLTASALWSTGNAEDPGSALGALLLMVTMLFAVVICARRLDGFVDLLVSLVVACATLSAAVYLVTEAEHPWGRLHTPTIACMVYGLGFVLAAARVIGAGSWLDRGLWSLGALLLAGACYRLGIGYVLFGIVTAAVVVCILYTWRMIGSWRVYPLFAVLILLLAAQIMTFGNLLEADRQLIWQPVVDMVYEGNPVFGSGLLTAASPGLECGVAEDVAAPTADCVIQHPHNIYVATMYYGGVIGLGLLLLVVLAALAHTIEAAYSERKPVILAALAYSFSVLMFDGNRLIENIDFIWLLFWLPVALAIVLNLHARERDELEEV